MRRKFEYLPKIAIADVAFKAYGESLAELFKSAALAFLDISVDPKTLKTLSAKELVKLQADNLEDLLYDFLSELIFFKDTQGFLAKELEIQVDKKNSTYTLQASLQGVILDPKKYQLRLDVKAVTKHLFEVRQTNQGYSTRVVLDI